jgi:hypothetical protein
MMETMLQAIRRLRAAGYPVDFVAVAPNQLRCGGCGIVFDGEAAKVDETVRFEGESNPDDQAILNAISAPCGHRGLFSAAYGVYTSRDESGALRALSEED